MDGQGLQFTPVAGYLGPAAIDNIVVRFTKVDRQTGQVCAGSACNNFGIPAGYSFEIAAIAVSIIIAAQVGGNVTSATGTSQGNPTPLYLGADGFFFTEIAALLDAYLEYLDLPEKDREAREYAGEVNLLSRAASIYTRTELRPGTKEESINRIRANTVISFHSHPFGSHKSNERPSNNDFRENFQNFHGPRLGALFTPRGDIRLFLRTFEYKTKYLGLVYASEDQYWTIKGQLYDGF